MSSQTLILQSIHSRFRDAFGQPYSTLGMDSQWTLRPHPEAPAIFVLVNGSHEKPATWIFDPYNAVDNVWRHAISSEAEVARAIQEVRKRLAIAVATWAGDGHAVSD